VLKVWELHVRCLIATGTSHLEVAIIEVVVLGSFGNSVLGNFQFGLWLQSFGAQVLWWEMES